MRVFVFRLRLILAAVAVVLAAQAQAQDHADIDRSQIIGNRELPKVLYIVPWKHPTAGDLTGRPLVSVLDEALAPLDRDVFLRQVNYQTQAQTQAQAKSQLQPQANSQVPVQTRPVAAEATVK